MFSVAKRKVSLTGIFFVLCLVPFILSSVGYFYVSHLSSILREDLRSTLLNTNTHATQVAQLRMENALDALNDVAKNPIIANERVTSDIKSNYLKHIAKEAGWRDVILVDTLGSAYNLAGKHFDLSESPRFKMALQGESAYSEIFSTENYPDPTVSYSMPIQSKKASIIGVIIVLVDASTLHFVEPKKDTDVQYMGKDLYMDANGTLINKEIRMGQTFFDTLQQENPQYGIKELSAAVYTQRFLTKPLFFHGVESYMTAAPIGTSGWSIVTVMPESVARKDIDSLMYWSLAIIIVVAIALIIFMFYVFDIRKDYNYHKTITDAVLNTDNVLLMVLNPFGAVVYANTPLCDRMGWLDSGRNINIFRWMEDVDMAQLHELMETEDAFVIPLLLLSPAQAFAYDRQETVDQDDSEEVEKMYIQWSVLPNDRQDTTVLLGTDVSAHKQRVEMSLAQSHYTQLRQILDSLPALVTVHELDGTVSLGNAAAHKAFGAMEGEDDRHFETLPQFLSSETLEELIRIRRTVISTGEKASSTFSFQTPAGEEKFFECVQTPIFNENGAIRATVSLNLDITRLHILQQQLADEVQYLHEILDESPVGVFFSTDRVVTYCNVKAKEMAGLSLGGAAPDGSQMVAGDVRAFAAQVLQSKKVHDMPFSIRTPSGSIQHLLLTALYTHRFGKRVTIVWALDVTDIRRAQDELIDARDLAESATRAKTDFLATMSHEIRTPMNAVLGFLHVFDKSNLNEKQLDYLDKISISASGLLRIINDILDFSKIEANKMDLERVPFNLRTSLNAMQSIMAFKAQEKGLQLVFNLDEAVPENIVADRERINQILLNLIGNAIKFTSQGSVFVDVALLTWASQDSLTLRFCVRDTGIGLSEEHVQKLFQPFTQADTSTSRRFGGTGLGLVISQRLVQLMGGDISLVSTLGEGTTFTVDIPVQVVSAVQVLADIGIGSANIMKDTNGDITILRGKRLLIAEDNMINQEIVNAMLEDYGFDITFADNGQEAVALASASAFDLIFMDVQMPIMDGLEATRTIRGLSVPYAKSMPIIAMTANVMLEDKKRCDEAGMNGHVAKPIDPQELHAALMTFLGKVS